MKGETIILLVKELERIRGIRSRNSYFGAWCGFIVSIISLAGLYMLAIGRTYEQGRDWLLAFFFIIALIILLQSFYIIIRHITNKRISLIIEALLEKNKID